MQRELSLIIVNGRLFPGLKECNISSNQKQTLAFKPLNNQKSNMYTTHGKRNQGRYSEKTSNNLHNPTQREEMFEMFSFCIKDDKDKCASESTGESHETYPHGTLAPIPSTDFSDRGLVKKQVEVEDSDANGKRDKGSRQADASYETYPHEDIAPIHSTELFDQRLVKKRDEDDDTDGRGNSYKSRRSTIDSHEPYQHKALVPLLLTDLSDQRLVKKRDEEDDMDERGNSYKSCRSTIDSHETYPQEALAPMRLTDLSDQRLVKKRDEEDDMDGRGNSYKSCRSTADTDETYPQEAFASVLLNDLSSDLRSVNPRVKENGTDVEEGKTRSAGAPVASYESSHCEAIGFETTPDQRRVMKHARAKDADVNGWDTETEHDGISQCDISAVSVSALIISLIRSCRLKIKHLQKYQWLRTDQEQMRQSTRH
jgi:hypothetical protein